MPPVKHAVIAAAGLGSRLGLGKPKCLLEVQGRPLIQHQLMLLADVPDVRIVVGFEEQSVIDAVISIRRDAIIVRNPAFRSTTTLISYKLGAVGVRENTLFMDADILFERQSFAAFLKECEMADKLVAITRAKTADAVYVHGEGVVERFSRTEPSAFEWANLCWLPPGYCESGEGAVFERLSNDLPLRTFVIESYEIDTPADYQHALANVEGLKLVSG